jgi:predicted cobalt transporter CbtA
MSSQRKLKNQAAPAPEMNKPWLKMKSAVIAIAVVSVALAGVVAYQIIRGSGNWGQGLLWGLLFASSIWLIFFGMNWFHSIFHKK